MESLAPGSTVSTASSDDFFPSVGVTSEDGAEINALIWEKNSKCGNEQTCRGQRTVVVSQDRSEADGKTFQGSDFTIHKQETPEVRLTHSGWSGGGLGMTSSTADCKHRNVKDFRTSD